IDPHKTVSAAPGPAGVSRLSRRLVLAAPLLGTPLLGALGGASSALAQATDGGMTNILRQLAPHDRRAAGAPARRAAPRQLRTRRGASVTVDMNRRLEITVFFDLNSATLRPDSRLALLRLARALNDPLLIGESFIIAGHSSADGDYQFNVELSDARAQSVRDWLIASGDVAAARLQASGFGPDLPRNASNPASPVNRRVEIIAIANL
ncbi:MAG: OmpA family protein, partial [Beijerinckiaceae bacterium]